MGAQRQGECMLAREARLGRACSAVLCSALLCSALLCPALLCSTPAPAHIPMLKASTPAVRPRRGLPWPEQRTPHGPWAHVWLGCSLHAPCMARQSVFLFIACIQVDHYTMCHVQSSGESLHNAICRAMIRLIIASCVMCSVQVNHCNMQYAVQ